MLMAALLRPYSASLSPEAALKRLTPSALAAAITAPRVVSPMDLAGLLTTRLKDSSSLLLTTSLKYAIISLTSALSKKDFPEKI